MPSAIPPHASDVGQILRVWRRRRGLSQIELAVEAGVSQRHVSFVESGRSAASRAMLQRLARVLNMPLREQDVLLLAGGFAPVNHPDVSVPPDAMVRAALERVMQQHEPYPALVLDRYWNVVFTNAAAPLFFSAFVDLSRWPAPRNLLRLLFDPAGLQPVISDFDGFAQSMIERVRRETVGGYVDTRTAELLDELRRRLPAPSRASNRFAEPPIHPVVPLTLRYGRHGLSYFSLVTTVGTPGTITTEEWRMECMVPADETTQALHPEVMAAQGYSLPLR